jgi:uncharacterized protein
MGHAETDPYCVKGTVNADYESVALLGFNLNQPAEGANCTYDPAAATAAGQCSRCLIEVTEPIVAGIRELFAFPDSATAATTDEDEIPLVVDDRIDLQQVVRDEIVTALPMAPLCRPDCRGLCPDCGGRFDDLEPDHSHEILDPRWAALRDRFGTETPESTGRPPAGPGK